MNMITLIPVAPVGTRDFVALVETVNGGQFRTVTDHVYPCSDRGEQLHAARISRRIGLREASAHLGIRASEYCGLEAGKFELSDEDWAGVDAMLGARNQK